MTTVSLDDMMARLDPERRREIEERAKELIAVYAAEDGRVDGRNALAHRAVSPPAPGRTRRHHRARRPRPTARRVLT